MAGLRVGYGEGRLRMDRGNGESLIASRVYQKVVEIHITCSSKCITNSISW